MRYPYKAAGLWYKWRDAKLIEEYQSGSSVYEIAMKWHYRQDTVKMILKHYGVKK